MYVKQQPPFSMRESAKTLAFLTKAEKELRRKRLLSRLLPPVGTVIFLFNLLLASVNTVRLLLPETLSQLFDAVPVLPALAEGLRGCFSSIGSAVASLIWFVFLIPMAICGGIVLGLWLYERYRGEKSDETERPTLSGDEAADAKMLVERAETVYLLRADFPSWSVYREAAILTALLAIPFAIGFVRIAGEGVGATLQLTMMLFLLLVSVFALYWVYVLLLFAFSSALRLFYLAPGKWELWELYHRLDVYRESIDPAEFARRERQAEREAQQRRKKWWYFLREKK